MYRFASLATIVALFVFAFEVKAQVVEHNDLASVSPLSPRTVRLAPGQALAEPFSVRYVNAQGNPLPGLAVWFAPNGCAEPATLGPPQCPPPEIYGTFTPPMHSVVHTDANGVATSNAFVAGDIPGSYDVFAVAWYPLNEENAPIGDGGLGVFFEVQQTEATTTVPISAAFTGAWYDPNQSGHGLLIEVLTENRILAYWFTFDPDGKQAWFGGDGVIQGDAAIIYARFGTGGQWIPNFDPLSYQLWSWGQLFLTFTDCDHGRVEFVGNGYTPAWGVGHMDLTRLTTPAGLSCN